MLRVSVSTALVLLALLVLQVSVSRAWVPLALLVQRVSVSMALVLSALLVLRVSVLTALVLLAPLVSPRSTHPSERGTNTVCLTRRSNAAPSFEATLRLFPYSPEVVAIRDAGVFDGKKTGRRAGPARQAGVFVRTHIVPFVGVGVR